MSEASLLLPQQLTIDPADIAARHRLALHPGVEHAVLWRDGRDVAGVMWLRGGAEVPPHRHNRAEHHVWILAGRARVEGRDLGPGGYWHVPPGVEHRITGVAPTGCTLAYLYVRRASD